MTGGGFILSIVSFVHISDNVSIFKNTYVCLEGFAQFRCFLCHHFHFCGRVSVQVKANTFGEIFLLFCWNPYCAHYIQILYLTV